jgi:hypothetical protein
MKSPFSFISVVSIAASLSVVASLTQLVRADDFSLTGEPSAEIVNHLATDDVPAEAPDSNSGATNTASDPGQTVTLPESTPPQNQAAPEKTSGIFVPNGIPIARF